MTDRISIPALRDRAFECSPPATELLALVEAVEAAQAGWKPEAKYCPHCGAPTMEARARLFAALARFDFGEDK